MGTVLRTWPSSRAGKVYELTLGDDNVLYCTCPAWRFTKKRPRTCKHIEAWQDAVGSAAPAKGGGHG
jgi:predicted nucleic acid-binding Zn finger protein